MRKWIPIEQLFGLLFAALIFAGPGLHAVSVHLLNSYLVMPPGTLTLLSLDSWLTTMLRMGILYSKTIPAHLGFRPRGKVPFVAELAVIVVVVRG